MKLSSKSEWFVLDSPLAEPNEKFYDKGNYHIERTVNQDGTIIWFGCSINWKRERGGPWTVLTTNEEAKPLKKHLPEIVYGSDRTYWKECVTPIYEKLYMDFERSEALRNRMKELD